MANNGDNNCFLNATIQALWHLGPFRIGLQRILEDNSKSQLNNSSILNAIINLFINYEFTDLTCISPLELRKLLSSISDQFLLGDIADSNEVFEYILNQLHNENHNQKCPGNYQCLSHTIFSGILINQSTCTICGTDSEPTFKEDYVYSIYAHELLEPKYNLLSFSEKISKCLILPNKSCLNKNENKKLTTCKGEMLNKCYVLEAPLSIAITIGWTNNNENTLTLSNFMNTIENLIYLNEIYQIKINLQSKLPFLEINNNESNNSESKNDNLVDTTIQSEPSYLFRGMVCYYGKHYISIFQDYSENYSNSSENHINSTSNLNSAIHSGDFILFDDQNIRKIGNWTNVKEECIKSRYQPVLLLYELQMNSHRSTTVVSPDNKDYKSNFDEKPFSIEKEENYEKYNEKTVINNRNLWNNVNLWPRKKLFNFKPKLTNYNIQATQERLIQEKQNKILDLSKPVQINNNKLLSLNSNSIINNEIIEENSLKIKAFSSIWGKEPKVKDVLLYRDKDTRTIGLDLSIDSENYIIIVNFTRNLITNELLPAELSLKIDLLDRIIAIQGISTSTQTLNEVTELLEITNNPILLTLESIFKYDYWYTCICSDVKLSMNEKQISELLWCQVNGRNMFISCNNCRKLCCINLF